MLIESTVPSPDKEFHPSVSINKPDGWLLPQGIFYGCSPEEHDTCAEWVFKKKYPEAYAKYLSDLEEDIPGTNIRKALHNTGSVQISAGRLMVTKSPISENQLKKINAASIEIPVTLDDTELMDEFIGLNAALKLGIPTPDQRDRLRNFINNSLFVEFDDSPKEARRFFDLLTIGFNYVGEYKYQNGYTEQYFFKCPPSHHFAVELRHHVHVGDGRAAGVCESEIYITTIEQMHRWVEEDE